MSRVPPRIHLDSAAAGRSSPATRRAVAEHLQLEVDIGGYVAEEAAGPVLGTLRSQLAGLLGVTAPDLGFVESGTNALAALLGAWPISRGERIWVAPSEWGPNLAAFAAAGLEVEVLAAEPSGCVDLDALESRLRRDAPTLVHLVQMAAHRGLVQPVAQAGEICRAFGVPLWVDAAQAVGHLHTTVGADAVYGTSRKWLRGPRGVGFVGVKRRHHQRLRWAVRPEPGQRGIESAEANIAGRVGLAVAVGELIAAGTDTVVADLHRVGVRTREALSGVSGWRVVGSEQGAITALAPTAGQDVVATRARLLAEAGIVTTASLPWRVPNEMTAPLLRVSPHRDCTPAQLAMLAMALHDG
ncbi:MAG: aminotransferase class V-fold PLP-dependent enzyme [Nocardioides sp.]